jgi:phosphonate degradation associated HDIG domain protein
MENIEKKVDEILELYTRFGDEDYIGEPVSQLEHMSQTAQLAIQHEADDEVVLAAFFHDIGHFCDREATAQMDGYGFVRHELIGANFLRQKGFPERIAQLIENHVQAKRYLTFVHPDYYDQLSAASKQTLTHQGGVMSAEEATKFESHPYFHDSIKLRTWDEQAKQMGLAIINFRAIKEKAIRVLSNLK